MLRLNREIDKIVVKRSIANLATGYKVLGGTPKGADKPISLNGYSYDDGNFYVAGTYLFAGKQIRFGVVGTRKKG